MSLFGLAQTIGKTERSQINENLTRISGQMKSAWYEKRFADTIPPFENLSSKFIILVDINSKATNFISFHEGYLREQAIEPDTSYFSSINLNGWNNLSFNEKSEIIKKLRISSKHQADSIHAINNQGQNQIWIINTCILIIA